MKKQPVDICRGTRIGKDGLISPAGKMLTQCVYDAIQENVAVNSSDPLRFFPVRKDGKWASLIWKGGKCCPAATIQ